MKNNDFWLISTLVLLTTAAAKPKVDLPLKIALIANAIALLLEVIKEGYAIYNKIKLKHQPK